MRRRTTKPSIPCYEVVKILAKYGYKVVTHGNYSVVIRKNNRKYRIMRE